MGAVATTTYEITCDNPDCPGNSLDPTSFTGWIQVTALVHLNGDLPVTSAPHYYCSSACAGTIDKVIVASQEAYEDKNS